MASYAAAVRKASDSQQDLKAHREHCAVDPARLATIGCVLGDQVRIRRSSDEYGLYTVSAVLPESPDTVVRVGLTGRRRLGTDGEFDAVVDSQVPNPTMSAADAKAADELVEQLNDDGRQRQLIVIAPHGGDIELRTDDQAERVGSRLAAKAVSFWRCMGWKDGGGAFARWHITSTDISPASFPRLDSVFARGFAYAVAFHGFDEPGIDTDILIGGAAPDALRQELKAAIEGATAGTGIRVRVAGPDDGVGGDDPRNIVNRLTTGGANGIQIEQSPLARSGDNWAAVADAVAAVYERTLAVPAPS